MANITGLITVNGIQILEIDSDPRVAPGAPAPIGSFASAKDASGLYRKYDVGDVDWLLASASGGVFRVGFQMILGDFLVGTSGYVSIAKTPWIVSRNSHYTNGLCVAYVNIRGKTLDLRIIDRDNNVLGELQDINTDGLHTFMVMKPVVDGTLELQARQDGPGQSPIIECATIEFET